MAEFYSARGWEIPPLPWTNLSPPFSQDPDSLDDAQISEKIDEPRRYAVVSTRRALREIDFRDRVLTAYGQRCAMCGVQLHLLDGAHILPAAHADSTDGTDNGVALCALHHRAFDGAFVTFDPDFRIRLNVGMVEELKAIEHAGGLKAFKKALRTILDLPPDKKDRVQRLTLLRLQMNFVVGRFSHAAVATSRWRSNRRAHRSKPACAIALKSTISGTPYGFSSVLHSSSARATAMSE